MLTKINNIIILMILLFLFISCERKIQFEDQSLTLSKLSNQGTTLLQDSLVVVNCIIFNKSDEEIFIPVSAWFYNGKKTDDDGLYARPEKPYFKNTIHYYPNESNLNNGIFDMNLFSFYNKWPLVLKINPGSEQSFKLYLSKYYIGNDSQYHSRYKADTVYSILIGLPIYTKNNLLKIIDEKFDYHQLLIDSVIVVIPSLIFNNPNFKYKESGFSLSRIDCEYLNILSENRLIMKFEVEL